MFIRRVRLLFLFFGNGWEDLASGLRRGWSLPAQPCRKPSRVNQRTAPDDIRSA
jgi:hypothetical protein